MGNWSGVCVGPNLAHGFPACTVADFLLYDLGVDPGQRQNLAADHADVVVSLLKIMEEQVSGTTCCIFVHLCFGREP